MANITQQIFVIQIEPLVQSMSLIMAIGFLCLIACHCSIALYVALSPSFQQHIQIICPQQRPLTAEPVESTDGEEELCYVCYESKPDAMLLPCGHLGLCIACVKQLCNIDSRCPLCRAKIAGAAMFPDN